MRVLDLFAGTRGWSHAFTERGHDVFSVELEPDFPGIDWTGDVRDLKVSDLPWKPDVILASPPCTTFSMMTVGKNWTMDGQPKTPKAELGRDLVLTTVHLIETLAPRFAIIENPRARLRTLGLIPYERKTLWQCQYGRPYAKPTDLWGMFPNGFVPLSCRNGASDHVSAPRGSRTGVQGGKTHGWYTLPDAFGAKHWSSSPERKSASRAVAAIPYDLSLAMCLAMEGEWSGIVQLDLWRTA